MATGDPAIDNAFSGADTGNESHDLTGDEAIDSAFRKSAKEPLETTQHEIETRADPLGQEPVDLYGQKYPWGSVGRSAVGAVTNLANMIPFAGSGIADAIRRHTKSIQPQNEAEEVGAGGISATVPLMAAGMGGMKSPNSHMTAEDVLANQAGKSQTNMGAAAAAPSLANISTELKQAIVSAAQKTGGAVPPDALARHVEADSLPVKIQLTKGQALQDPTEISNEVNARGKDKAYADRYNDQNKALGENLHTLRDQVGPDVFTTNQVEHGDALIDAYKAKDAAAQTDINAKYKALRDANGATMPIDTGQLISNIDGQLKKQYLSASVPPAAQSLLSSLRAGEPMDFEGFEAARSRLAEAQRGGGSEAAAAKIIRNQLEQMPLSPEASGLKDLANSARSAAKARFDALDADPAYDAAVHGTVPAEKFTQKFIIGAPRNDVATMRKNLADNETATQTMGVAALDHLRTQARVNEGQSGNFASDSYNKALQSLAPKVQSLVDPKTSETLSTLGNVSRYVKGQPAGAFVNNSNTFVAQAGEHAKNLAEGTANAAIMSHGIPIPGGTMVRKAIQGRAAAKARQEALEPGAGLTRLSDIAK